MIALLVALGLAALAGLQPWATDSVAPRLSLAPGLGVALGDAVPLAPGRQLALAPARPAAPVRATSFAANPIAKDEGDSRPRLGIAAARAVTVPAVDAPGAGSPTSSEPEPPPPLQPVAPPVAVPVAAPSPPVSVPEPVAVPTPVPATLSGNPSGPIAAGPGPIVRGPVKTVEIHAGEEYAFSFSFYIQPTVYRSPGEENLVMQVNGEADEGPSFGLQLWDDGGDGRGLWSSGEAMGGERFLAPIEEGVWHQAVLCFSASSEGDGFYLLLLDGQPIDSRAWVSLVPESGNARIEVGLFREGEGVPGAPDIFFGPTQIGETLESVLP